MGTEQKHKVWSIGGTTESVLIAQALVKAKLPCIITVATSTAQTLYPSECEVKVGRMDCLAMRQFCRQEKIIAVVDASHPYAVEVSQNAIDTARVVKIPYLRYERPLVQLSVNRSATPRRRKTQGNAHFPKGDRSSVIELDDFEALLVGNYLQGKRVLLTVGCQILHLFKSWQEKTKLFTRILPKPESLAMAIAAGFTPERIIALRPPISKELEKALWQQWQISLVVTKASGKAGGEDIKRQVASELNIPLIIVSRPQIIYPQKTDCLEEVIAFCRQFLSE